MLNQDTKICLTGGGTGGSVTPLLSLADYLIKTENLTKRNFIWIGSKTGLERRLVEKFGLKYYAVSSGKLRRYWSWRNLVDPFLIKLGFLQALSILKHEKPQLIISAGSFVAVPVVWAGWCRHIPSLVHQMDVRPGLANRLMAPAAKAITVTFAKSLDVYGPKASLVGNMVRPEIAQAKDLDRKSLYAKYNLTPDRPVVLVVGGGTGAQAINQLIIESLPDLKQVCQIIHQTGAGKEQGQPSNAYQAYDFLSADQLAECYVLADLVVSRAGLGFISELAHLSKPSIVIPMPDSHQEDNADLLKEKRAAIILYQKILTSQRLAYRIKSLLSDQRTRTELANNIHNVVETDAESKLTAIIKNIL